MQGATKAAIGLDPSCFHLGNGLQLDATASLHQVLLGSGESLINESRLEDRHNKCSWIQRLKPRDEMELPKGGEAEASLEIHYSERGNMTERMDMGSVRPSAQVESNSDVKRQKLNNQRVNDGEAKRRSDTLQEKSVMIEHGKYAASMAMAPPSNVGFGPWVNVSSGRKPEKKPEAVTGSKIIVDCVTTSTQEFSKDIQGNFRSAFTTINSISRCSPANTAGVVTASRIFHKGPSSPVHSKLGLPPKPPGKKSPGFQPPSKVGTSPSEVARGMFNRFSESPSNREGNQAQDKDLCKLKGASIDRTESSLLMLMPSKQFVSNSVEDHGKGPSDSLQHLFVASPKPRMGIIDPPVRQAMLNVAERASDCNATGQPMGNCVDGAAAAQLENGMRGLREDLHAHMSREGAITNLPVDGVDLHLTVSVPGREASKATSKNQTRTESNKTSVQVSPSGNSRGSLTSSNAGSGASGAASLPWEMFIEPAASKMAREQFVKVYNRARDELKNQRMSQTVSRVSAMDGGPKLTLGPGDATSERRSEREVLKHEQQSELNILNSKLESRTLSLESCLKGKEPHSISHAERKGLVMTLGNEQSGLHGVSLTMNTLWKQGEGFRREQTQPKGKTSLIAKIIGNGSEQVACQSLDERSAVHVKELGPVDKGHSSTVDVNIKELASPALVGKRSRVTFEEHSISRVSQKGAGFRVRQVSSPHVWLQRWHPNAVYNFKTMPEAQSPSDRKSDDTVGYLALGLKKFRDGDGVGVFSGAKQSKSFPANSENGMKTLRTSPLKMLPSAAAMAIVGTAARQFCAATPHRKGSFAFWSGYDEPSQRKVEPVREKGKDNVVGVKSDPFLCKDVPPHDNVFMKPDSYTTPNS